MLYKYKGFANNKKRISGKIEALNLEEAKELWIVWAKTNPKGNTYHRFLKWRKICWETRLKVDPDGYRLTKLPSGGLEFVEMPIGGWLRKKLVKASR